MSVFKYFRNTYSKKAFRPSQSMYFVGVALQSKSRLLIGSIWSSGIALSSRTINHNTSEIVTPATPTSSSSHTRHVSAPSTNLLSGFASAVGAEPFKNSSGLAGLLGPPPKSGGRGRKKIKAENTSGPLLVVPYPILASGADQSSVTITAKEGKSYR